MYLLLRMLDTPPSHARLVLPLRTHASHPCLVSMRGYRVPILTGACNPVFSPDSQCFFSFLGIYQGEKVAIKKFKVHDLDINLIQLSSLLSTTAGTPVPCCLGLHLAARCRVLIGIRFRFLDFWILTISTCFSPISTTFGMTLLAR